MNKPQYKFSTMMIWVVTGFFILTSFINLVGISNTFKYFLFYFIVLLLFFGLSLWLKKNWICYIPSYFLIFFAPVFMILTAIFNTGGDSFGRALIFILAVVASILAGISYFLAKLFISYVILNKDINLIKEMMDNIDVISISIGVLVWVNLAIDLLQNIHDFTIFFIIILLYTVLMILGSIILSLILYAYDLISKKTSIISLLLFLIYFPISQLIQNERMNFFIIFGFSIWLIFGTLFMMGFKNIQNKRTLNSHEEGEFYD